jgi:hypothetical protein
MQAVLTNSIKLIKNNTDKKYPLEVIPYLIKAVENADAKTRNEIENLLVKIGNSGISTLVNKLESTSGTTRALIAMVLIRLGSSSIEYLKSIYQDKAEFEWMVNYIVNEIEGTQKPLGKVYKFTEVLAG